MMPEKPTKDANGNLIATFDILDTPNGRIAYTLAKYGYKLGISSRGGGDTYTGDDGEEHVDEDTYDFHGFDLVLLPAVKAARLKMVESLQNGKTFKAAISEALENATADEKKIMQETLNNLNINYDKGRYQILVSDRLDFKDEKTKEQSDDLEQLKKIANKYKGKFSNISIFDTESGEDVFELDEEYNHESVIDKKESDKAVDDAEAEMISQLQETVLAKNELEAKNIELQEKLSVCYAKEAKMEEDLIKYKSAIQNLSVQAKNAKALQTKVSSLQEELEAKQEAIKLSELKVNELLEQMKDMEIAKEKSLNETLTKKNVDLKKATAKINTLQESINTIKAEAEERYNQLNEELAEQKKNLSIKSSEYSNKLSNANKLIEQYRATAKTAVNKYIESQATRLGVKSSTIFEKLPKNYSFNDIDIICEELGDFKLKVSDLPFNIEPSKVTIKESKNNILPKNRLDDTIDESLMALANLD
jgi:hypothetical protein